MPAPPASGPLRLGLLGLIFFVVAPQQLASQPAMIVDDPLRIAFTRWAGGRPQGPLRRITHQAEIISSAVAAEHQWRRRVAAATALLSHGVQAPALRAEAAMELPAAPHEAVCPEAQRVRNGVR